MRSGPLIVTIALGVLAVPLPVHAQPRSKPPRVGVLMVSARPDDEVLQAFRPGLRTLGSVDGQNVVFECRVAEGRTERLGDLAADLVRLKVDVIVAGAEPAVVASLYSCERTS
jgi:putative ABC transport system substrate-binding protein